MAVQYCVVCGRGSDRTWNNTVVVSGTTYIGCDFHSIPEILGSAQNLQRSPGPDVTNQDPALQESQGA